MLGVRDNSPCLPHGLVEVGGAQFLYVDAVDSARDLQFLRRNFAFDANDEPGTGEWVTEQKVFRNADISADAACRILYLVFERAQFRYGEVDAGVVVHFYLGDACASRVPEAALTKVGVKRPLCDKIRTEFSDFFFQHAFVHVAHRKPLLPHGHFPAERVQKERGRDGNFNLYPVLSAEILVDVRFIVGAVDAANVYTLYFSGGTLVLCVEDIAKHGRIRAVGMGYED